ncbi:MAG: hypothetical protein MJ252_10730 [archaeon]|nr:hypothetical protein [archaeon]
MKNTITYLADNLLYALSICPNKYGKEDSFIVVTSTKNYDSQEQIEIITLNPYEKKKKENKLINSEYSDDLPILENEINIDCPITSLSFSKNYPNILASTSDILRIDELLIDDSEDEISLKNLRTYSENNSPLISMDWSIIKNTIIGTTTSDGYCILYDINYTKQIEKFQSNYKESLDISFTSNENSCCVCGGDGSVRFFDFRNRNKYTTMFKLLNGQPVMKCKINKNDNNYILIVPSDSKDILLVDRRYPSVIFNKYSYHLETVNDIKWIDDKNMKFISGSNDNTIVVWDCRKEIGKESDQYNFTGIPISNIDLYLNRQKENNWAAVTGKNCLKLINLGYQ